jgi:hypothetical protein
MGELISFPDPESVLTSFLTAQNVSGTFAGVKASTRVPNPRPAEFVRVLLVGGFEANLVTDVPRLAVEAWGNSKARAQSLAAKCRQDIGAAARDGAMGSVTLHRVNVVSRPQNLPDPESDMYRYTATYELALRA